MGDNHDEIKAKKRAKQFKRMSKILGKAWEWDTAFQDRNDDDTADNTIVLCLTDVGQRIDEQAYRLGRHGWEDFSRDLSGVFHRHMQHGKTKKASRAEKCLENAKVVLGKVDASLAKIAEQYVPPVSTATTNGAATTPSSSRKRKVDPSLTSTPGSPGRKKKKTVNKNSELAKREVRAMEMLSNFVDERGGKRSMVAGFSARVTKRGAKGFDTNFFNQAGRRFRSMLEVGRFLNLVNDGGCRPGGGGSSSRVRRSGSRKASSREQEAEKKKLRKELERLRKAHQRASKALDDFTTDEKDTLYPMDDIVLMEEDAARQEEAGQNKKKEASSSSGGKEHQLLTPTTCAAARTPDIDVFPGLPQHAIPDVLMTWDFLCTFERVLSLAPIGLDDFVDALVYVPPEGQTGDDLHDPPVYLAEAHLGLLKALFSDRSSDDWWWSTLETDESHPVVVAGEYEKDEEEEEKPLIKIDLTLVLAETEDPVLTASWIRALENVEQTSEPSNNTKEIKAAVKTAMKLVSNKWVMAYLRKALASIKVHGVVFTRKAVLWLVGRIKEARPDIFNSGVSTDEVYKARAKVIEETNKQMEALPTSAPSVGDEDIVDTEYEEDDDDDSDDSDDDEEEENGSSSEKKEPTSSGDQLQREASAIPPRPAPSYVDLLLPPSKPTQNEEFVNAFTWPHLVGATLSRTLHRRKRVFNEVDDSLRAANHASPLTVSERRERERSLVSRVLTECVDTEESVSSVEGALRHLCEGGSYIQLSPLQRLCVLRLLVEAAYDTGRLYDVVSGNYKQRVGAMKALDVEQRRAKREAKEKAAAEQAAAREQLAEEAREQFLDEKRAEIKKLNDKSKEFSDEVMESLTYEDIIDFDDDIKADYEALPGPESFNKTQVSNMVARMQQEAAFDTDALRVISMDELLQREQRDLEEMEGQLVGFGGENALLESSLDRETVRSIERLQRDIAKAKLQAEKLPELRQKALEQLKDAIADGTIKVLRSAITAAKKAKLTGPDDETGGAYAVDLMRDAALELEKAKQNKRVFDARKDLIAKRNKCFIRCDPLGQDRFGNCFWSFNSDARGHIWAETEYSLKEETDDSTAKPKNGFLDLRCDGSAMAVGSNDMEADFLDGEEESRTFSRQEYHRTGFSSALVKRHWGCHTTEESLRGVIKLLDSRGVKESDIKTKLKGALDEIVESDEKQEMSKDDNAEEEEAEGEQEAEKILTSGDETAFEEAKRAALASEEQVPSDKLDDLPTALGSRVRLRLVVDGSKDPAVARYDDGSITGWKMLRQEKVVEPDENAMDESDESGGKAPPKTITVTSPVWRVQTDRGKIIWCDGKEVFLSLVRCRKRESGKGYFESDAAFFAYRNNIGRHCGRAADAPYAASPNFLARVMVKREGDLYPKLKIRSYDNNWGGKSGSRALWTNSMKDYAYDFQTVRQGLLTLEGAFYELTLGFSEYESAPEVNGDVQAILDDPAQRLDIELESIEKNVPGLWNSPLSRAVFLHLVSNCKTTGFLALALDLLCRNTMKYCHRHKLLNVRTEPTAATNSYPTSTGRRTRRMNAWQQQQQANQDWY